jgi:glucose/arabinose dehydrogenase
VIAFSLAFVIAPALQVHERESHAYAIDTCELPEGVELEVGGLLVRGDGSMLVCTRRGEVFAIRDAFGEHPSFTRYAQGLHEPLGLAERDGWIYVIQRSELSRMRDADGDDRMDELETVCDAWPISGNYHEYNFGPAIDRDGSFWITTNKPFGDEPFGRAKWRGFALKIASDGGMQPIACGLRSPAGVGISPGGDVFYTDNQGEWCGASKLAHVEPGDFHGHPWGTFACDDPLWAFSKPGAPPNGVPMPEAAREMPTFKLPAVWFPYDKMGRSPAGFVWDETGGRFGPFAGQLFVSDQYQSSVMRVFLERVSGRWQGACFPFRTGFQCGIIRLAWESSGALVCGQTDRGWGSLGSETMGLQRLRWTGALPFEIRELRARPDGFELQFTAPVDAASAADPSHYTLSSYTYLLHETYGSDEVDKADCVVREARVSEDRLSVHLVVEGMREGYVHELDADVPSAGGEPLLHDKAYYTLIAIPR